MEPSRNTNTLIKVMEALRDKKTGCPWDIEQDFKSIAPFTIEEAYEVADAIAREDSYDLCDELGDLLLQVIYHSQMAKEKGLFEYGDVVEAITRKMIRRHPHVFGDAKYRDIAKVKGFWEEMKSNEKKERQQKRHELGLPEEVSSLLDDVPVNHPALTQAIKLQQKTAKVGFDWPTSIEILDKIQEEISELHQASEEAESTHNSEKVEEEFGDILFSIVNLARHLQINPEQALQASNQKFRKRFAKLEDTSKQKGIPLREMTIEQMDVAWDQAKLVENSDGEPAN